MFFTSLPACKAAEEELGRVIDAVCQSFEDENRRRGMSVCLAQTLLSPGEKAAQRAFEHGGFHELARLAYLGRPVPTPSEFEGFTPWQLPSGVVARSVASMGADNESTREALLRALSRSYEQTMDCPELCTLRAPEDVLDSHRSVNRFDPRWWWVIELDGEAEGAMLFTVCPDQGNIELVYLGISPRLRGRGLARDLMRSGMCELAMNARRVKGRERGRMTCAVDLKNEPARRVYRGLGFQMTAERVAMVRSFG
jgi:ribosomal protein S18 acetylase RimI-like enzyme